VGSDAVLTPSSRSFEGQPPADAGPSPPDRGQSGPGGGAGGANGSLASVGSFVMLVMVAATCGGAPQESTLTRP